MRDGGMALAEIGGALGVSESSLGRWVTAERAGSGQEGAGMREVKIAAPVAGAASVALVTPRGYRVEGLDIEGALRLLQEL